MNAPLSGSAPLGVDPSRLGAGDRLTIMVDGLGQRELHLKVLRVAPALAHRRSEAWICGIDVDTQRVCDVLVRADQPGQ